MDNDNTNALAVLDVAETAQLALVVNFTFIGSVGINAAEHVHQRGFARAVFAAQSVDFLFSHLDVYLIQRLYAGKLLGDIFHLKDDIVLQFQILFPLT